MKINKTLISVISIFCFVTSIQAKDSYYYYKGKRVFMPLSDDSVCVYSANNESNGHLVYTSKTVSISQKSALDDESITSVEYMVREKGGALVKMSNRFYVQLFDSIADVPLLQNVAKETNSIILGKIPNMPDWYKLVAHNSVFNNSLELSNYFYETGLFRAVNPGFIFNYTPSSACVTDTHFTSNQWGMSAVNACEAWSLTKGSENVKIAIIDGDIYTPHTEFSSTQFVNAYNTTTHTSNPELISNVHGTMLCGIIASDHNHEQIAGIAPDCKIIPISYTTTDTSVVAENLAEGITWAINHGADVINCSWGDHNGLYQYLHDEVLEDAIQNALTNGRNGKGCVVVFASGNQGVNQVDYPAYMFSDILTVGAINSNNMCWYLSSHGTSLDIVAPGVSIYSTSIFGQYGELTGTSLAAPYVSGIAGLLLSTNSFLTQKEVADIIESTAQKVGGYTYSQHSGRPNGTWNNTVGYGLVDAYLAVSVAKDYPIYGPDYVCDTTKYYLWKVPDSGSTITWSLSNASGSSWNYSIVGPTNQDTVRVKCVYSLIPLKNGQESDMSSLRAPVPTLSVTINNGLTSETFSKKFQIPSGDIPMFSASSSATWYAGTPRTFTVTNCLNEPNSAFVWVAKRGSVVKGTGTGRTFTFTPTLIGNYTISVINTNAECGNLTNTLPYFVTMNFIMSATIDNNHQLNITISEDNGEQQHSHAQLNENSDYTIELWHSIYGRMKEQAPHSSTTQIDTSSLPQGVYVVVLKENGEVIAQTKVQIY